MSVFDQVKVLYDSCLYEDVKNLTSILLTLAENTPELLSPLAKYQMLVYQADSLFHLAHFKKAEHVYMKALQVKKALNKSRGKAQSMDMPSEVEVKYQLYQCYCQLRQYREAVAVLEGIVSKQRNAKINMALGKLYQKTGMDRSAITNYKEVLRECPMSLEAAQGLLGLGVKGAEVASLMMNNLSTLNNTEWLSSWVKAQGFTASREYDYAILTFKMLDNKTLLRDNIELLCSLGETQFLSGDYSQALTTLQRAHSLDRLLLRNTDLIAYLMYREKKAKELESFATELMTVSETAPEPWVAMGFFCMSTKKATRAIYFAQKAYTIDSQNQESLLLKGLGLLDLKRYQEAILHYRELLRLGPHRYEAHKGLVDCYVGGRRMREAINCAGQAFKQLGTNARSLTLYASVLAKEPLSLEKAKGYLEKAMKLDPNYVDAVYIMADILGQQHHHDKAIELLRRQLRQHSTCRLHQVLGDFLTQTNEHQEALDQYRIALSMDPTNERAKEGMERVEMEKHSGLGMDNTYDVEVEDMDGSDNEADLEGSDLESAWSDIDVI